MEINNNELKKKYNNIYKVGAYQKYFSFNPYDILKAIIDSIDDWTGLSVLDIGCGEGDLAAMISFAGAKIVRGVDYSIEAINISNNRFNIDNVSFDFANGRDVSEKYDVIVMAGVLEHIDDPFDMLNNLINKNLNTNGVLITASPSFLNPRGYVWMTLQILLDVPMSLSDIHFFSPDVFDKFAEKNNYRVHNTTISHDWGGGGKTILDFKKRLVNALSDAKLNNTKVEEFLDWMEHTIPYFDHNEYSGAIMITRLSNLE
jgi:SAM-dependent methyltransferase